MQLSTPKPYAYGQQPAQANQETTELRNVHLESPR